MDIGQVLLNILAQVMFFVVNLFVLPGIAAFFILKDTDANNLLKNGDEFDADIVALKNELETLRSSPDTTPEDWEKFKKRGEKLKRKVENNQKKRGVLMVVYKVFEVIESWTVVPLERLIRFVILLVTFNSPRIEFSIDGAVLNIYLSAKRTRLSWLNPIKQIGRYLSSATRILFGTACGIFLLSRFLPATFDSTLLVLNKWIFLGNGPIDIPYFINMWEIFKEAAWDKLIVGGFRENPILLIILVLLYGFVFANATFDIIDEEEKKISSACIFIPITVVLIVAFNFIFAAVNPVAYDIIAQYISLIGMTVLFVMIIKEFSLYVVYCVKKVTEWLWDKFTDSALSAIKK